MRVKPLPEKAQKFGRKLSLILAIVFGVIFGGSLAGFIGLTLSTKKDELINTTSTYATSLKDVDDGFIYSTQDNHLVYSDYDNNVKSDSNLLDVLPDNNLGELQSIDSLSYVSESKNLYVTVTYFKDNETEKYRKYLFRFEKQESNFTLSDAGFVNIKTPITEFTEHGDYFYALIRDGDIYCTINRFNKNNLANEIDSGYLYEKRPNVENEKIVSYTFNLAARNTFYSLHYQEDVADKENANMLFVVGDNGVFGIKDGEFSTYSFDYGKREIPVSEDIYSNYLFYDYSSSKNYPKGVFELGDKCYMITKSLSLAYFDYSSLEVNFYEDSEPEVNETKINNFQYSEAAPENRSGLFYNAEAKKGAIITRIGKTITFVDFEDVNNAKILFTDEAEVNITDVVISSDGEKIYYLCQNSEVTGDNSRMLKLKLVDTVYKNFEYGKYTPLLLVVAIISLLLFLLALFAAIKTLFLERLIAFGKNIKQNWVAYVMLLVSLTLLAMFCYYPAVGSISMSFFNYKDNQPIVWNNFKNYIRIFTDPDILKSFWNMVFFLVADVITAIIPPLIFAFFLTVMKNKKISAVTRTLLFLPSVIPGITKMMIWQNGIYGEFGVINTIIKLFQGKEIVFLNGSNFDIWALVLMGFPYVGSYLVFYGAMMNIPSSYYEAAELEGMNVWRRFFGIDIPLIKPQIKYVVILTIIASVQNFGRTYMLNSALAQQQTITPIHIMYNYINTGDYGLSSAIAAVLFVLLLICTIMNLRKQKEKLGDAI